MCPIAEGRLVAAGIPGAQFVELDSRNHILRHEAAWARFQEVVSSSGLEGIRRDGFPRPLPRERDILAAIAEG